MHHKEKLYQRTLSIYQAKAIRSMAQVLHKLEAVKSVTYVNIRKRASGAPGYGDQWSIAFRYKDVL